MPYDPHRRQRRSVRLPSYDYRQPGAYFVTLVTRNRECVLGEVSRGQMQENPLGKAARSCWLAIPDHFPSVVLDAFVVMPNHVHGIIILRPDGSPARRRGVQLNAPTTTGPDAQTTWPDIPGNHLTPSINPYAVMSPKAGSLAVIVRTYKGAVTTHLRREGFSDFAWQRGYYEHVVRSEAGLCRIREYIQNNPAQWGLDRYNLKAEGSNPWPPPQPSAGSRGPGPQNSDIVLPPANRRRR